MIFILQYSFSRPNYFRAHRGWLCCDGRGSLVSATRWVMVCDNEAPGEKWVLQNFQSFKLELSCIISIPENDHYSTGVQRPLPVGENVSLMSIEYWFSSDLQL